MTYKEQYREKLIKETPDGRYTVDGEADLQCGIPIKGKLFYLAVEVKTELDYARVMSGVVEKDNRYVIIDRKKLKKHEPLQIAKLNQIRNKGGLGLIAYEYQQILEYIKG